MNRFGELLRSLNNLRLLAAVGRSGGHGLVSDPMHVAFNTSSQNEAS
jgi:hypothetical protein